ncbi:recombinase family protein, partial [Streptomyces sp. NRRL WC-3742]|uniref:recombinase family protein n=1 Tax=Streptomyces sp. NRRL WC-3742 TaxID=1463934 RepID=UPI00131D05D6
EEASQGKSQRKITLGLTADGWTGARGGPVRVSTVGKILRNPVYLGWQTVSVRGRPQTYLNGKGKPVDVFAKGFQGISQATWDKQRRVAAGHETPEKFGVKHDEYVPPEPFPVAGMTWCAGGGIDMEKGHRANSTSHSFRCGHNLSGIECPEPVAIQRPGVLRVVLGEWKKRLTENDPTDPTMVAVAKRWVVLQQPRESGAEAAARAQIKIAEEAVARLDRLNAGGAYPGPAGESSSGRRQGSANGSLLSVW